MRLIDANDLADALFEKRKNYPQWVADTIGAMPDAIVRCKDCKHYDGNGTCMKNGIAMLTDHWFCSDGEGR